MKKLFLIAIFNSLFVSAQVGINVVTPKATLDVTGKPSETGTPDGVIIPRLTGDQLAAKDLSYTSDQNGTLIYATEGATLPSSKTDMVTEQGVYFYDSIQAKWRKLITGVPLTVQAFNGERVDISSTVTAPETHKTLDFSNVNISPTSDIGIWDAATSKFTVQKKGVYNISAGLQMYNVGPSGTGAMIIFGGQTSSVVGSVLTESSSGEYSVNCNGVLSGLLNVGDTIYVTANSGNASWQQGRSFLHIIYTEI